MIDTVRLKYPVAPTAEKLRAWDRLSYTKASGKSNERFILNLVLGPHDLSVRCTHIPLDFKGYPLTTIELSLPKAVYGDNFTMLTSIDEAIETLGSLLGVWSLPPLDIPNGILLRVDPCYNHQVGPLVADYVNAIGRLEYPHRRTKHHKDEGAEFRAKQTTTKFYDKQRESGDPKAHGILRQETSYLDPKRIAELIGKEKPTLRDITPDWVAKLLRQDLAKLRLNGTIITDHDSALDTLCDKYGPREGVYLWGLLKAKAVMTRRQLCSHTTMNPRTLDRGLKAIAEAGMSPTLSSQALPALEINL
jgi:hypothetical protein